MSKNIYKTKLRYIFIILLYFLYQANFIPLLIKKIGIDITKFNKPYNTFALGLTDAIYILIIIFMFKNEIKKVIKDIKDNKINRIYTTVRCWLAGCLIMFASSLLIGLLIKNELPTNEELVRESIKLAPIYMLFTCSIVAPIFEEMVFRISLHGLLKNKWLFILLSGFIFGALHVIGSYTSPLDLLYIIPYGAMGSAFAYLLAKTKNITLPILIHMIHNTILVFIQLIGR